MDVGLVYHPDYLKHDTGRHHPEHAGRLEAVMQALELSGRARQLVHLAWDDDPQAWIAQVHDPKLLTLVQAASQRGRAALDPDTMVCSDSFAVALKAVAGTLAAADAVMQAQVQQVFCAVRPPGHHAESHRSMGFCLFNNVAILARYLQQRHGLEKILIIDWDVHHGNGTQDIFWEDPTVFYYSLHQYPFYPGTGSAGETGAGPGLGFTLNRPLPAQTGDSTYLRLLEKDLDTIAHQFNPQLVIISAGFDAHRDDPLGGMNLSTHAFTQMTQSVLNMAEHCAKGRVLSLLEGGYDLQALADSAGSHVEAMLTTPGQ